MKSGVKTSEFWVAMIAMVVALVNETVGLGIEGEELAAVFGPPVAYIFSRGMAKRLEAGR